MERAAGCKQIYSYEALLFMMTIANLREEASHGDNFAINTLKKMALGGNAEALLTLKNLARLKLPYIFPCLLDMVQSNSQEMFDFLLGLAEPGSGYSPLLFQDNSQIHDKSFALLLRFKEAGDPYASALVRKLAEKGHREALLYIVKAAEDGDKSGIAFLINHAEEGDETAIEMLEKIAAKQHRDAVFWLDVRNGAISDLLKQCADAGDDHASRALIALVDKGNVEAPYLLKKAADAGSLPAIFWFDRIDKEVSVTLEKEAWKNNYEAVNVLGDMAEKGNVKAFSLLKRMATHGSRDAHAFTWFMSQVSKGDLMAAEFLFSLARKGNSKTIAWLEEQAEKGDDEAIDTLKMMLDSGNVEPTGNNELILWCGRQAERGDLECYDLMIRMAKRGEYLATRWLEERQGQQQQEEPEKENQPIPETLRDAVKNVQQYLQKYLSSSRQQ